MLRFLKRLFIFFFVLITLLIGVLYLFGDRILPEKKIYEAVNGYLVKKTGLSFKYEKFSFSITKGLKFTGIKFYDKGRFFLKADSLGLYITVSLRSTTFIQNNLIVSGAWLDYNRLSSQFLDRIKKLDEQGNGETDDGVGKKVKDSFKNTRVTIDKCILVYQNYQIVLDGTIDKFNYLDMDASIAGIRIHVTGELKEKSFVLSGRYNFHGNEYLDRTVYSVKAKLKGNTLYLNLADVKLKIRENMLGLPLNYDVRGYAEIGSTIRSGLRTACLDNTNIRALADISGTPGKKDLRILLKQLDLPDFSYSFLSAKKVNVNGSISPSSTVLKINTSGTLLDLPFLKNEIYIARAAVSYNNGRIVIAPTVCSIKDNTYKMSLKTAWPIKKISLDLQGSMLSDKFFTSTVPAKNKEGTGLKVPVIELKSSFDTVRFGKYTLTGMKGSLHIASNILTSSDLTGSFSGNSLQARTRYDISAGEIFIDMTVPSFDMKDVDKVLETSYNVKGKIKSDVSISLQNGELRRLKVSFTNLEPVFLRDTDIQDSIWRLPIFNSAKSTEDIFYSTYGDITYYPRDENWVYDIRSLGLLSGEYETFLEGSIIYFKKQYTYDLNIRLLYSDTFKKYISLLNAYIRKKSTVIDLQEGHKKKNWLKANSLEFSLPFNQ